MRVWKSGSTVELRVYSVVVGCDGDNYRPTLPEKYIVGKVHGVLTISKRPLHSPRVAAVSAILEKEQWSKTVSHAEIGDQIPPPTPTNPQVCSAFCSCYIILQNNEMLDCGVCRSPHPGCNSQSMLGIWPFVGGTISWRIYAEKRRFTDEATELLVRDCKYIYVLVY